MQHDNRVSSVPKVLENDFFLLGLRLVLAVDLARLLLRRWSSLDASLRTLEVGGFPSPGLWLGTAMLAGSIGIAAFIGGWQVRGGAAITLLLFMPIAGVFTVSYVPIGWVPWMGMLLPFFAMTETLFLGFGLMTMFLFGGELHSCPRASRRWLCFLLPETATAPRRNVGIPEEGRPAMTTPPTHATTLFNLSSQN